MRKYLGVLVLLGTVIVVWILLQQFINNQYGANHNEQWLPFLIVLIVGAVLIGIIEIIHRWPKGEVHRVHPNTHHSSTSALRHQIKMMQKHGDKKEDIIASLEREGWTKEQIKEIISG